MRSYAAADGHYRLIEQPKKTAESIPAPCRTRCPERIGASARLLCAPDGSDLNFATQSGSEGLWNDRARANGKKRWDYA